ncbi:MAG: hypothetical protein JWM16_2944 [Verrucomicrobiales bacterium]|nr:hypothetical protein [Verrucomicrobiales bacterium]
MKRTKLFLLAFSAASLIATQVQATPIVIGTTVVPNASVLDGSATLLNSLSANYSVTPINGGTYQGTLNSYVYQESAVFNPLGGLTFVYQVFNGPNSASIIEHVTVNGYNSLFVADTSFSGLIAPTTVNWSFGNVMSFNFATPFIPGPNGNSGLLIVRTTAHSALANTAGVIDGTAAGTFALAPSVPDGGSTLALMGGVVLALGAMRRKLVGILS